MWARLREICTVRRMIYSLLLALAGYMIIYAFQISVQEPPSAERPREVVAVFPAERAAGGLRQEPVGFQLVDGWTGTLRVDGREIPLDQLERPRTGVNMPAQAGLSGLNRFSFSPGRGKDIEQMAPGAHNAEAIFWPLNGTRERDSKSYIWRFNVN